MINKAELTGDVYQDKNPEREFNPVEEQLYFVMRDQHHEFTVGLISLLECIKFAENQGELPKIPEEWWITVRDHYQIPNEPIPLPPEDKGEI